MELWLQETLPGLLGGFSILALLLVFLGGIVTSISPCNMAMIPAVMAYVGAQIGDRRRGFWLSLSFALGSASTFMLLGIVAASIGGLFGNAQRVFFYLAAAVCIFMGLKLLKLINFEIPVFTGLQARYHARPGLAGAFILGLVLGLAGSQCATPILAVILSLVMLKGNIPYGALLLFIYALGRGLPVVAAGTFTSILTQTPSIMRWVKRLEMASGLVMLALGIYFIWTVHGGPPGP